MSEALFVFGRGGSRGGGCLGDEDPPPSRLLDQGLGYRGDHRGVVA